MKWKLKKGTHRWPIYTRWQMCGAAVNSMSFKTHILRQLWKCWAIHVPLFLLQRQFLFLSLLFLLQIPLSHNLVTLILHTMYELITGAHYMVKQCVWHLLLPYILPPRYGNLWLFQLKKGGMFLNVTCEFSIYILCVECRNSVVLKSLVNTTATEFL